MCARGFRGCTRGTGESYGGRNGVCAMKKLLIGVLGGAMVAGYVGATTQDNAKQSVKASQEEADRDIAILRKDIRAQKRQVIETKVPLTDAEAQKFWPVYDQYTADLVELNNVKYALIKSYTESYDTMTDAQADEWSTRMLKLDADVAALRQKYWPRFRGVLSGKKTALYEQVERRTQMVIDAHLASEFPLTQPQR
jgi:hypothetical protein